MPIKSPFKAYVFVQFWSKHPIEEEKESISHMIYCPSVKLYWWKPLLLETLHETERFCLREVLIIAWPWPNSQGQITFLFSPGHWHLISLCVGTGLIQDHRPEIGSICTLHQRCPKHYHDVFTVSYNVYELHDNNFYKILK